ncbi:MAG: peptidylprolyl isomerase [Pseudomonadota bacterium]
MQKVKSGDYVRVSYTGTFDDGQVFDSNEGNQPFEFQVDGGQVIQGFNDAVKGMITGEEKSFRLTPTEGYGERNEDMVRTFPVSALGPDSDPQPGQLIGVMSEGGRQFPARITNVDGGRMTVDLNSPLAGQNLNFRIRMDAVSATPSSSCGSSCSCSGGCDPRGGCNPRGGCGC